MSINVISQNYAILVTIFISFFFAVIGIYCSRKYISISEYLLANRSVKTFGLTASFVASALGSWVLFGPASAATWGGIGAVIGYSLGTALPMFFLIFLGKSFRQKYPNGKTLVEVFRLRFGNKLYKLILLLSLFYMTIFLIAEVTAVSILIKYMSDTKLWVTSLLVISSSLIYTLYGGLRASIFTDKIQFLFFLVLIVISYFYLISINSDIFNFSFIQKNTPSLLNINNEINFTAGITFFLAVAATNLFHQGNWQRVYAAKNYETLRNSLIIAFLFIVPIVFIFGFSGMVAKSLNSEVLPDLAFFTLIFENNIFILSFIIIVLAISLTVSSIDTLMNAISSLLIVDVTKIVKLQYDYLKLSKLFIFLLAIITFLISSQGISILYLFLLADLFCCAAVIPIFYGFYCKSINEKKVYLSIIVGLVAGLLFFPSTDYTYSILVGLIIPDHYFADFVSQSLLFWSFLSATFLPLFFLIRVNHK